MDETVSGEEWQARVDCAAGHRLLALYGLDDLIFTHLSVRVPGEPHAFLLGPFGCLFEEITASSLVKVDLDGNVLSPTDYQINRGGFVVHSAIHAARPDAMCVIHLHTTAGVAVSAVQEGLLPLTQTALLIPNVAYHDYEGPTVRPLERARLAESLGANRLMFLRNHGTLALGSSVAEAFLAIRTLERACEQQVATLAMGLTPQPPSPAVVDFMRTRDASQAGAAARGWPALLRKLDREMPGYDE